MATDVKNVMCNESSASSGNNSGSSGGLKVFGKFGLSGGTARNQFQNIKNEACSNNQSSLNAQQLDKALSNMVDHESVEAWNRCISNKGSGLIGSVERDNSIVYLRLRWVAKFDVDSTKIESVTASGVQCSSLWQPGTIIKSVLKIIQCDGDPLKGVSVTINTDRDSIVLKSPVIKVDLPDTEMQTEAILKPEIERCYDGDYAICNKLATENNQKCNQQGVAPAALRACQQTSIFLQDISVGIKERDRLCRQDQPVADCNEARERLSEVINMHKSPMTAIPPFVSGAPPRVSVPR